MLIRIFRFVGSVAALLFPAACTSLPQRAACGDADAQFRHGRHLLLGRGAVKDAAAACSLFKSAAEQGHPTAMAALALCYERGWGVTRDRELARTWYEKAERAGHADSSFALASMDMQDGRVQSSVRRLDALSERHNLRATLILSLFYMDEDSPLYAPEKGVRYLRYAAMDGSAEAAFRMSVCYEKGIGVSRHNALAQGWLAIAREQGYREEATVCGRQ